jgi:hypothetical protein
MPSDPMTNHMPQISTSSLPCVSSYGASCDKNIKKSRKRPGLFSQQGSRKGYLCLALPYRSNSDRESNFQRPLPYYRRPANRTAFVTPPQHRPMDIEGSSVQQTPESGRPPKRVSQACEACRYVLLAYDRRTSEIFAERETDIVECSRKKSRCPGEKPACSLCARLKQTCVYADDGSMPEVRSAAIERRMVSLVS